MAGGGDTGPRAWRPYPFEIAAWAAWQLDPAKTTPDEPAADPPDTAAEGDRDTCGAAR
jgi:hypothetical protein